MNLVGLTGAPGCGKSAALKAFAALGRTALDADSLCRKVHETPEGIFHRQICMRWGKEVLAADGTTNRAKVAEIVFRNPEELAWLESCLYPAITEQAKQFFQTAPDTGYAVFEVPLLFERKWELNMTKTVAVWSPAAIQRQRLTERGWSPDEIERRCSAQFSADKKLELADYGIINDGTLEKLQTQIQFLDKKLMEGTPHGK